MTEIKGHLKNGNITNINGNITYINGNITKYN